MNRRIAARPMIGLALLGLVLVASATTAAPASAQDQPSGGGLTVALSLTEVSAQTGDRFTFTSAITNAGSVATPPLIASLNFTSLDEGTYVDPEDWSPRRTQTVASIAPGATATLSWTINPILEGEIAAFVVVMADAPRLTTQPLVASQAMYLQVGAQMSLNPGGVLPVVIAVPGALAVLFAGLRLSRERRRA
jgi:hypothetical protein